MRSYKYNTTLHPTLEDLKSKEKRLTIIGDINNILLFLMKILLRSHFQKKSRIKRSEFKEYIKVGGDQYFDEYLEKDKPSIFIYLVCGFVAFFGIIAIVVYAGEGSFNAACCGTIVLPLFLVMIGSDILSFLYKNLIFLNKSYRLGELENQYVKNKRENGYVEHEGEWVTEEELNEIKKREEREKKLELETGLHDDFRTYDPYEFEEFVAKLFRNMEYEAHTTSSSGDFGIDVVAENGEEKVVIQVKKFSPGNVISLQPVQRTLGAIPFFEADRAIFITTSSFTRSAREVEIKGNIELWNGTVFKKKVREYMIEGMSVENYSETYFVDLREVLESLEEIIPSPKLRKRFESLKKYPESTDDCILDLENDILEREISAKEVKSQLREIDEFIQRFEENNLDDPVKKLKTGKLNVLEMFENGELVRSGKGIQIIMNRIDEYFEQYESELNSKNLP